MIVRRENSEIGDDPVGHARRAWEVQLAHVAVGRGEELRVEDFLDFHERHHGRPRDRPGIQRRQRTEVEVDLVEVSQHLARILEEDGVTPPVVAEVREFLGVMAIPEKT
jgi:hypothetical protein